MKTGEPFYYLLEIEYIYHSYNKQMISVQGGDSCGRSGKRETPQTRCVEEAPGPPAESEALHGNNQRL